MITSGVMVVAQGGSLLKPCRGTPSKFSRQGDHDPGSDVGDVIEQGRDAKLTHSARVRSRRPAATGLSRAAKDSHDGHPQASQSSQPAPRPVLIVSVDAAGDGGQRPRDVRLLRTTREQLVDRRLASQDGDAVTAVVLLRAATPSHVVSCVRAATGGQPVSAEILRQISPLDDEQATDAAAGQLSHREYEVLRMLADGASTRTIAEQLSYSERTVKNIVHDLLAKLNCKTRAHAVALAVRQGVI